MLSLYDVGNTAGKMRVGDAEAAVAISSSEKTPVTEVEVFLSEGIACFEFVVSSQDLKNLEVAATTRPGGTYVPLGSDGELALNSYYVVGIAPAPGSPNLYAAGATFLLFVRCDGLYAIRISGTTAVSGGTLRLMRANIPVGSR